MNELINKMIEEQEAKDQEAKAAAKKERSDFAEKLFSSLYAHLGDFAVIVRDQAKASYTINGDGINMKIPALDDLRLAPIEIRWGIYSGTSHGYAPFKVWGEQYKTISETLKAAREAYPEYLEEGDKKRVAEFEKSLSYYYGAKVESVARSVSAQYAEEFPDRKEKAEELLADWIRLRDKEAQEADDRRKAEETRKADEALKNTLRIKYILELSEWLKIRDAIEYTNTEKAERIQETADLASYRVYKLTYALIAKYEEDGEEETQVETREVYTFQSKADPSGYWMVDGTLTKFYNPVKLEVLDVHASSGILSKRVKKAGYTFFFTPSTSDESIADILSIIEEYPDEPEHPGELGYLDDYTKRTYYLPRARALLNGEGETQTEDEAPF